MRNRRSWAWLNIVARLKPGLSLKQAEAGANVLCHQILEDEAKNLQPPVNFRTRSLKTPAPPWSSSADLS